MGHGKKKRARLAQARQDKADLWEQSEELFSRGFRGDLSLPPCLECDCARVWAPLSEVPPQVVEQLSGVMEVEQFTYCLGCGKYSALGGWEMIDDNI
jgi:hypothetical protein